MSIDNLSYVPWNKGKLVGQKLLQKKSNIAGAFNFGPAADENYSVGHIGLFRYVERKGTDKHQPHDSHRFFYIPVLNTG